MKTWGRRRGFSKVKDDGLLESENGDEGLFLGDDDIMGKNARTNREGYPLAERIQSFSDERRMKDIERLKEGIGPRSASTSDLSTVQRKTISPSRLRSESVSVSSNHHKEPIIEPLRQRSMSFSLFDPFDTSSRSAQTDSYNPFTEDYEDEGSGPSVRIDFNLNEVISQQDQGEEEKQDGDYDETTCLSGRGGEKNKSKGRRKKRGKERGDEEEQDEPEEEETPRRRKSFPFRRNSKPITPRKDAELLVRSAEVHIQQRPRTPFMDDCENDDVCFEGHVNDKKHKSKNSFFSPRNKRKEEI